MTFLPPLVVIQLRRWHDWCGIPIRLGCAAFHFSMLLTMLRYLSGTLFAHSVFPVTPSIQSMTTKNTTMAHLSTAAPSLLSSSFAVGSVNASPLVGSGIEEVYMAGSFAVLVFAAGLLCLPFNLLGVWTGRTVRNSFLTSYHILSHLGSTGYLLWWWIVQNVRDLGMEQFSIFFYVFIMLPTVVEVTAVILSVRRGLD